MARAIVLFNKAGSGLLVFLNELGVAGYIALAGTSPKGVRYSSAAG